VSDRVAVMYLGRLCEVGPADAVYTRPRHPYTVALLDAVPRAGQRAEPEPAAAAADAEPPSPLSPPSGCRFRTRCPRAQARCATETPPLEALPGAGSGHLVACHYPVTDRPARRPGAAATTKK
jgi:peptide/nickel transport system ATP-binding protein